MVLAFVILIVVHFRALLQCNTCKIFTETSLRLQRSCHDLAMMFEILIYREFTAKFSTSHWDGRDLAEIAKILPWCLCVSQISASSQFLVSSLLCGWSSAVYFPVPFQMGKVPRLAIFTNLLFKPQSYYFMATWGHVITMFF